ncbi:MAG: glutamine amidotransferase [Deltaproteobacteria bacterium]|nr:glutamine amidotransferase [Deltaproteobacteria bacterium]
MITVIKHAPHEGLGTFESVFRGAGHEIDVVEAWRATADDWTRAREADVLVVMGGAMGVYERERFPFLDQELELLGPRIARDAPTFGVCLGSQLIAEAAGSKVAASGRHEIGWFGLRATGDGRVDPLVNGLDLTRPVFHWHGDTFATPAGGVRLLESDRFPQQGFRLGKRVYGVQFHPEVTAEELPLWIAAEQHLAYGRIDGVQAEHEILEDGKRFGAALTALSEALITRYLKLIS